MQRFGTASDFSRLFRKFKTLLIVLIMALSLSFAACSNEDDPTGGAQSNPCACWHGVTIGGETINACSPQTDAQNRTDCNCEFGGGQTTTQAVCPD